MANNLFKASGFGLTLTLTLLLLFLQRPAVGQPADNITFPVVPESNRTIGLIKDPRLEAVLITVGAHFVVQFSQLLRNFLLAAPPATLQTQLNGVTPRISVQFSQAQRHFTLTYPSGKLNDTTPPAMGSPGSSVGNSGSSVTLTWSTNEFAQSTVAYGTQPGAPGQSVGETGFAVSHSVVLSGLTPATAYYYVITNVDRDGNSGSSGEASFVTVVDHKLYLPMVRR